MVEFNESIERENTNLEQTFATKMSRVAKSIFSALFMDDYEGTGTSEQESIKNPADVKDGVGKTFSNDYSEGDASASTSEGVGQEKVDLTKRFESNSKFKISGQIYETDDKGYIYKANGYELRPNCEYTINGVTYKTDDLSRIISCDGNVVSTPEGERDGKAQTIAGDGDRKEGDQGAHILARIFGGAKGIENMLAMRGNAINQSVYKRMENEIGKALEEGKEVHFHVDVEYEGVSRRPSKVTVTYMMDGKETVFQFDNDEGSTDLMNSLENKVDECEYNDLKQEIQDANDNGINMSVVSVKTEYSQDGDILKVTVTIRDENGNHPANEDRVFTLKEAA